MKSRELKQLPMPEFNLFQEAGRQLTVCNACRYCEGYCPLFRAIETRRDFAKGDVLYLANLCHDCRACFYACMYEPPHEFAINIPQVMANVRVASYQSWSSPEILARSFTNPRIGVALAAGVATLVVILSVLLAKPSQLFTNHREAGAFYEVVPYLAMVISAVTLVCYWIAIWLLGGARFWSEAGTQLRSPQAFTALVRTVGDATGVPYLQGGGPGCYYPQERPSTLRRIGHSLVFWGFLSGLLSTTLAFVYQDYLNRQPPYALSSLPVVFGIVCGAGLIIGTSALIWLKSKSDSKPAEKSASVMDYVFLGMLGLTGLTGMLTLVFRATPAMGSMLVIHLACIAALFISAPYGKFVHGVYRILALLRYNIERGMSPVARRLSLWIRKA